MRSITLILVSLLLGLSSASLLSTSSRAGIPKRGRCNDDPAGCAPGLSCVGNVGNKRCFAKRRAGQKCGKDPFWVCVDGLTCTRNGRCVDVSGVKARCNDPGQKCAAGLVCVGNLGNKRCFPPRLMGDKCGKDPFWVCQKPLVCSPAGMCVRPKGKKGSCNAPTDACKPGLVCVGNVGNKRCFKPRREGDKCGKDPFWTCVDGLSCVNGMCVKGIPVKGRCNAPADRCAAGLVCVGNVGNKRCFPPRLLGDKCGKDPFWVCQPPYVCSPAGMCVEKGIPVKGRCNAPGDVCDEGLVCVGNVGNKRCFPPRLLGDKCGKDPFWVCQPPYVCSPTAGMCVEKGIPVKGSCNAPGDVCDEGLVCVGNVGNKKCFAPRLLGDKCGKDPFWVCQPPYVCAPVGMCVEKVIPVKGSCNAPGDVCDEGLVCVGNVGNKRCFPPRLRGDKCGKDPFWVCSGGLTCVDEVCV